MIIKKIIKIAIAKPKISKNECENISKNIPFESKIFAIFGWKIFIKMLFAKIPKNIPIPTRKSGSPSVRI